MPVVLALAIAGDRIAGGVGTHETALPSPDRVDLGGRCVLPGFSDAHVHFPTWALAQREVRLEERRLAGRGARARARRRRLGAEPGRWLRGRGWRSGDWSPVGRADAPGAGRGDRRRRRPRSWPATTTRSGSTRPRSPRPTATSRSKAASSSSTRAASRPESCARSRPGSSATAISCATDDEFVDAMRDGLKLAAARGVTAVHDKDGWLGAPRFWQRLAEEGALTLRVWQSLPHDHVDRLEELGLRSGIGDDLLRIGYLKVFMDGTLGSQTARLLDGSGRQDHEPGGAGRDRSLRRARRLAGRRARDRRPRQPRRARRVRGDPRGVGAARAAPADRARAAPGRGGHEPLRRARRRRLRPVQPRPFGPRHRRPDLGGLDRPCLCVSLARRLGRGGRERLGCADRGARSAGRHPRRSAAHARRARGLAPRAGGHGRAGARGDDRRARPGSHATSDAAASSSRASSPTWSSSTATRSRSRPRSCPTFRSWRRCSAAAGCTTRRPGTERQALISAGLLTRDLSELGLSRWLARRGAMCSTRKRSFGEWMFPSGRSKPVRIVGHALFLQRRHHRQGAADAEQERTSADHPLERVLPETDRRVSGGTSAAGALAMSSISTSAPSGAASRIRRSISAAIALSS